MTDGGEQGAVSDGVSVQAIATAPAEQAPAVTPPPGQNPLTGQPDPNLPHHLGFLGKFTGGGPEKAGNIAFFVILAAFVIMLGAVVVPLFTANAAIGPVMDKLVVGCISLITGALGYIFGASKGSGGV